MDNFSTEKLELPKILLRLENLCSSQLGKNLVSEIIPLVDKNEIVERQAETSEARDVLRLYPTLSLGGIRDIRNHLWRAGRGAILNPTELLAILDTLEAARKLKKFFLNLKENFTHLKNWGNNLFEFQDVIKSIKMAISDEGKVKDEASPQLYRIRRKIQEAHERIKSKLDGITRSGEFQKMLQDNLITIRGDRYVIPVKQEYRSQFPGLVHDQSASGATLFIEPIAVVELNNELRKLHLEEKREIEAILSAITQQIVTHQEGLSLTVNALSHLDFIFAKGRLSEQLNACEPLINTQAYLRIKRGRHPLITGKVVPLDLFLGKDFQTLVITGPNTGGKTVALKTVGLLSLMAQCGLHVPADPGTELAVFKQIYADIGDEQSIEQSLSTFSSHMSKIVNIVNNLETPNLILLDELGAGTDPVEGSALAMAILKTLHSKGSRTVATTHYSELKAFAYNMVGVENASVEFDPASLRPTYRLLIGTPGRSNAFEIALKLGLSTPIVDLARSFVSQEELEVGSLLEELDSKRQLMEQERQEINTLRAELNQLRSDLKREKSVLKSQEAKVLQDAYQRSKNIIDQAQLEVKSLIDELKTKIEAAERKEQERTMQNARKRLKDLKTKTTDHLKYLNPVSSGNAPTKVSPGDQVLVTGLNQKGFVTSGVNSQGEVQVQVGIIKVQVPINELRLINDAEAQAAKSSASKIMISKSNEISPEIDLRGKNVEEALEAVSKYLDDAILGNLNQVYIIHGKGTGVLRSSIADHLAIHPAVKNFRLGLHNEGGTGVTVVEIKN